MSAKDISLRATIESYAAALRDEPKLRFFFAWTLIDDIGSAIATWAAAAFNNDVVTTPAAEATVAVPMLVANVVGNLFGGVIADWPGSGDPERLARWRYKITVWRNAFHVVSLTLFIVMLALGKGSLGMKVAFSTVGHFISTLTQATRTAYFVDLLRKEKLQVERDGTPALDENGRPKEYKVHLLTAHTLLHQTDKIASVVGLLAGGWLLGAVHGGYWLLYAAQGVTYVIFSVGVAVTCHPTLDWRSFTFRQLLRDPGGGHIDEEARARVAEGHRSFVGQAVLAGLLRAKGNAAALGRFITAPVNYSLAALLALEWVVKLSNGLFNTRLLVTQTMGQDLEYFRMVELTKTITTVVVSIFVVTLRTRTRVLGWIVVCAVLLEGAARAAAGVLGAGVASAYHAAGTRPPFHAGPELFATVTALVIAGASAVVIGALASLAHQSCSSSALRGQIIAGVLLIDTLAQMASQAIYPPLSAWLGQAQLLGWAGVGQIVIVLAMLMLPRRGPAGFAILVPDLPARMKVSAPG